MPWRKYPYVGHLSRQLSGISYRPLIELDLYGVADSHHITTALIDSGSEASMMDMEIAQALGIPIPDDLPISVSGVSGVKKGFSSPVSFRVTGFDELLTFSVIFVEEPSFDVILGQQDFFLNFDVRFERKDGSFYLKEASGA